MKTIIKLILFNLLFTQIVAPLLAMIPAVFYLLLTTGSLDMAVLTEMILTPAQLLGQLLMLFYLWKKGYLHTERKAWSPVSFTYVCCAIVAILTAGFLSSELVAKMDWLPDLMKQSFDILQSGWGGILAIVLVGPLFEEVLFRGAITDILLHRCSSPRRAILYSALIFGICHINPAQIVPAFLVGLLLSWVYYRTKSLTVCVLMHISNNALSVALSLAYPEVTDMKALLGDTIYYYALGGSLLLLVVSIRAMNHHSRSQTS
jgi:membrane protease YdiL (CAAX protease family)